MQAVKKYGVENVRALLLLQQADRLAVGGAEDGLLPLLEQILAEKPCLSLKDLAVSGADLMALGIPAGPGLGKRLQHLLELVLEEKLPNQRQTLLEEAKKQ